MRSGFEIEKVLGVPFVIAEPNEVENFCENFIHEKVVQKSHSIDETEKFGDIEKTKGVKEENNGGFGVKNSNIDLERSSRVPQKYEGCLKIYTPNPEIVMKAQKDEKYLDVLNRAGLLVPDGIGIIHASKMKRGKIKNRITGIGLLESLLKQTAEVGGSVYLLGSKPAGKIEFQQAESKKELIQNLEEINNQTQKIENSNKKDDLEFEESSENKEFDKSEIKKKSGSQKKKRIEKNSESSEIEKDKISIEELEKTDKKDDLEFEESSENKEFDKSEIENDAYLSVAEKAAVNMKKKYPALHIVGTHHGYFKPEEEVAVVKAAAEARPDLLVVALGAPKQEFFIDQYADEIGASIAIGVGGALDVWAGGVKRAPKWISKIGMEWLYRAVLQPSRFRRLGVIPVFLLKVLFSKRQNLS